MKETLKANFQLFQHGDCNNNNENNSSLSKDKVQ